MVVLCVVWVSMGKERHAKVGAFIIKFDQRGHANAKKKPSAAWTVSLCLLKSRVQIRVQRW
jgi:hypothetical protein